MAKPVANVNTVWMDLRAYFDLTHPWAVLIVMVATALCGLLATTGSPDPGRFALVLTAMFGGQIAIGALNEYCDRDLDAKSHRSKPIPTGQVQPQAALWITTVGLLTMLTAGAKLGPGPLLLVCIGTGCGLAYDLWLKRTVWSWLPYLIALPLLPIWVWTALARFEPSLLLLYVLGTPMMVSVHLAQSLPDIEADRIAGSLGLGTRLGRGPALALCWTLAVLSAIAVALAAAPFGAQMGPATIAAAVELAGVGMSMALYRVAPTWLVRHLFKLMSISTVVLGSGWILAVVA